MAYARREHAGGAVPTTLNGSITSGDTSLILASASGWPTGSTAPFYLVVDPGLATEEKILATTRTTTTLNTLTRGVDGTSAAAHSSGAVVMHIFTATEADEANVAVNKTIGQVTTKGDLLVATGNQAIGRQAAGANDTVLVADSAQTNGVKYSKVTAAQITAATITATELAANSVITAKILDANVTTAKIADANITTAKILDANVTTAKIADAGVTIAKFASGLQPIQVCTSGTRPGSPTQGMAIYETDTGYTLYYQGPTAGWTPDWRLAWGHVATPKNVTSDQSGFSSSAQDITGCSFTYTAVANRLYHHSAEMLVRSDTNNAGWIVLVTNNSNVELFRANIHVAGATTEDVLKLDWIESGVSAGSTIRKLRGICAVGAGSTKGTDAPTQYAIRDDGPDGAPS